MATPDVRVLLSTCEHRELAEGSSCLCSVLVRLSDEGATGEAVAAILAVSSFPPRQFDKKC